VLSHIGSWVEIAWVAMTPSERAEQLPQSSRAVSVVAKVRGFALASAALGEELSVKTFAGRILSGTLVDLSPGHTHSFGRPQPLLLAVGGALREELKS